MAVEVREDDYQFHVLVVDDDATILGLLKEIMSMVPGCIVKTANAPAEAMQEIVKGAVDIVFTDIHMPGVTGLEMLRDIVALEKTPEVVVMTAFPSDEIAKQAMELGATSMLQKPFEDIAQVEVELEKAIKKILRQRSAQKEVAAKKAQLSKKQQTVDNDAVMQVSLPSSGNPSAASRPSTAQVASQTSGTPSKQTGPQEALPPRKLYDIQLLEALVQIESERCRRYNRQFAIGYVDLPDNYQLVSQEEQIKYRAEQFAKVEKCVRRSDVILDAGREGALVLAYECNKLGADVIEHKLVDSGFPFTGFAVFPSEGTTAGGLQDAAKKNLISKRKFQILVYEQEEFFGRLIQNMLMDPKYDVTWVRASKEAYQIVNRRAEQLKLLILSLTRDASQWELLAKFIKENLVRWPVLLFVDITLEKALRDKLRVFGVRAVVNKGISQEEFLYIVQSFVIPKPQAEERKNFRALVTLPVVYRFEGREVSSNTFTLSRDGLFIRELNPPPAGSIIDLEIFISGLPSALKTKAEVLYAVPYFVGVNRFHVPGVAAKFVDLAQELRDQIETLVLTSRTSYIL